MKAPTSLICRIRREFKSNSFYQKDVVKNLGTLIVRSGACQRAASAFVGQEQPGSSRLRNHMLFGWVSVADMTRRARSPRRPAIPPPQLHTGTRYILCKTGHVKCPEYAVVFRHKPRHPSPFALLGSGRGIQVPRHNRSTSDIRGRNRGETKGDRKPRTWEWRVNT